MTSWECASDSASPALRCTPLARSTRARGPPAPQRGGLHPDGGEEGIETKPRSLARGKAGRCHSRPQPRQPPQGGWPPTSATPPRREFPRSTPFRFLTDVSSPLYGFSQCHAAAAAAARARTSAASLGPLPQHPFRLPFLRSK